VNWDLTLQNAERRLRIPAQGNALGNQMIDIGGTLKEFTRKLIDE